MIDRPAHPAPPLAAGDRIDKFEIVDQIGAGAGSIVFKAYDRLLDRHFAIKQLMPGAPLDENDPVHERFRAEAGALKKVAADAKHVTRIIDLIDEPRGLFIVMEHVDGVSLEHRLATTNGPLDERDALGIVAATAVALESIHKAGLIHRDLKPSNILLPKGGGLKVCDFGVAAMIEDQEAMSVGTVRYMAPELFRADAADERADIYSLGLIAYELLAGRDKFNAAFKIVLRDQRNQALRWMKWHTNLRAKPPALNELNPKVSPTLAELVARMMEKDPAKRVPSATDLLSAIRRHFAGGTPAPVAASGTDESQAAPVPDSAPTSSIPKPSRWPIVLAVVLGLQVVVGLSYLGWQSHQRSVAREQRDQTARDQFQAANDHYDQGRFQQARDTFQSLIDEWGEDSKVGRRCAVHLQLVDARMAIEAGRFDEAHSELVEIQNSDMLEDRYPHIQELLGRASRNLGFANELAKVETLIGEGRLGEAQQTIDELSRMDRTTAEHEQLAALSSRVDARSRQKHVDVLLSEIASMLQAGERDEAIEELTFALERNANPRIEAKLRELTDARDYDAAIAAAESALGNSNLAVAITAFERAATIRPSDALSSRIRSLRGNLAYQQAQQAEQAGDTATAMLRYTEAAGFGHTGAQQAMGRIETAGRVQAFVKAGDQAMSRRDFAAAIEHYNSALGIESNRNDIADRRDNAMARLEIDKAEQMLERDDVEAARQAIDRALGLMPDSSQARQLLADIDRQARYLRLIAEGDALRSDGRFGEAATRYRDARREKDTELITQRIKQVEYEGIVANARHYMKQRQWAAAEAMLNTALKLNDTPEVRQLLAETRTHTTNDDP